MGRVYPHSFRHKAGNVQYPIIKTSFVYPFNSWELATEIGSIVCICAPAGLKLSVWTQADVGTSYTCKHGGGANHEIMQLGLVVYICVATMVDCEHTEYNGHQRQGEWLHAHLQLEASELMVHICMSMRASCRSECDCGVWWWEVRGQRHTQLHEIAAGSMAHG